MTFFLHHVRAPGSIDYDKTVFNDLSLDSIRDAIDEVPERAEILEALKLAFPSGSCNAWGVPAGAATVINRLSAGDHVLLVTTVRIDGAVPALCPVGVYRPVQLPSLSQHFWGEDKFPYIFFFTTEPLTMGWTDVLEDLGYKENWNPRGQFLSVREERLAAFGGPAEYAVSLVQRFGVDSASERSRFEPKTWAFQGNPRDFDVSGAVDALPELTWLVQQHRSHVRAGDTAYIWEAGPRRGLVAATVVLTDPADIEQSALEQAFERNPGKFAGGRPRVRLQVTRVLRPRLSVEELRRRPALANFIPLKGVQGTNFAVSEEESTDLRFLIGDLRDGAPPAQEGIGVPEPGPDALLNTGQLAEYLVAQDLGELGEVTYYGHLRNIGFDLRLLRGAQEEFVEVKSSVGRCSPVLTASEWRAASEKRQRYLLAVVDYVGSADEEIHYYRDPASADFEEAVTRTYRLPRTGLADGRSRDGI